MIEEKHIEQVLDRADIVEVISEYVQLKKKGVNYTACCPFHKEKTPSFIVSPGRNTWRCYGSCQQGGNAISFLKMQGMSFTEAVHKLALKYGVLIEENKTPPGDEEIRKRAKRESMFIINEKAAEYYAGNLKSELADHARKYIESRWGKEYSQDMGIGYATEQWDGLYEFAKKEVLSVELMLEIGLLKQSEKGRIYDMYRNRAMIPIRDKFRRVIGFTARDLSKDDKAPKYINSQGSDLYSKDQSLFGIDTATRKAIKDDKLYCVEGAPDVMRMQIIGIDNTVASLGAAWTDNQFRQVKKIVTSLCFIPDADPPKKDEHYGTGVTAVMKNGTRAMQCGFNVTVREIPLGEGNTKNDPDSYFTNKTKFDLTEEQDFITWYAHYLFLNKTTTEEVSTAIAEVCKLVTTVDDEVKQDLYIGKLQSEYKYKNQWTKAFRFAKRQNHAQKVLDKTRTIDHDLYLKYGFYEEHNSYYSLGDNTSHQWSNFSMEPMFHIKDAILPKRLYKIRNSNKQEEIIEMKQEDLVSLSKFKQKVEGLGNYIWLATEKELTKLKMFLYEQTETAVEIVQLGWNRKGFFSFGNGVFDESWYPVDEYGIVRLPDKGNYYLPASSRIYRDETKLFQFERKFVHLNYGSNISLREYAQKMIDVFGDNAKVGICFLLAALFRDVITGYTKSFPILNLFGPKGSGKSELGHSLMALFIIENTPPNIMNSTIASLADLVAQCANALVHIDEFKNTLEIDKREFLKGLWDGAGRSRMNMDRDKKREITSVDCGVILSGQEMATADIALFSRLIYLTFNKCEFSDAEKRKFEEMIQVRRRGLSHLTLQILRHRAKVEQGFISNYSQCMADVMDKLRNDRIEDRILRNWIIPLAAFRTLEGVLDLPFSYAEMVNVVAEGIIRQNGECKSNNELAGFWNVVSYLLQDGEIFYESDYRIDYMKKFKTNLIKEEVVFRQPKAILRLRKDRIFMLYKKFGKMVGDTTLPVDSLKHYLVNSKEYMGVMPSVRFKDIQKGQEVKRMVEEEGKVTFQKASCVNEAMCFDYEMLKESYSINLEVDLGDFPDEIKEEVLPKPLPVQGNLNM